MFRIDEKSTIHKRKGNKLDYVKIKNFLCERPNEESEKINYRLGENICRLVIDKSLISRTHEWLSKQKRRKEGRKRGRKEGREVGREEGRK